MSRACTHCGKSPEAVRLSIWYMHDSRACTQLSGNVDAVIERARKLGHESPWGMLCPVIVIGADEQELRRVGEAAHARDGFAESDLLAWRESVLADVDATRLLAKRAGLVNDMHRSG